MSISLSETQALTELAKLTYSFLPGTPMSHPEISFPGVAQSVGVFDLWPGGSKQPAIAMLLSKTLECRRGRFCQLMIEIVRRGSIYRSNKGNRITREEIGKINELILKVGFKIPELLDPSFLESLPSGNMQAKEKVQKSEEELKKLRDKLLALSKLNPNQRGFEFEKFLKELFASFGLDPRGSFRLVGEQIDGSFELDSETYLVEAKWQNLPTGTKDLVAFSGKVGGKATWSRGLFISYSGFSNDALVAFEKGRATNIIGMTGEDLCFILEGKRSLTETIRVKTRHAAETGRFYTRVYDLFPSR